MNLKNLSVLEICIVSIFTAIICVFAIISIPMPYGVPMTLQTFAISLVGIVLGAKKGSLSTVIYILLGTLGLPVFAGLASGIGVVFGPTGGFILSFPLMALAAGIGSEKGSKVSVALGLVIGTFINYLCGMIMFCLITNNNISTAFVVCVLPFIPTTIIKMILAGILGIKVKIVLQKGFSII